MGGKTIRNMGVTNTVGSRVDYLALVLSQIDELPGDWHGEGPLNSHTALAAFLRHAGPLPLRRSMETGTGKSTLLLSHISERHTVFTVPDGDSYHAVLKSAILNRDTVQFVLGPSQLTLREHSFEGPLDLAFLDGPHGYPFPELEYYAVYPYLSPGALLVVDDIHIPTISNLFTFLCEDEMFHLLEVADTTAFFRRTTAPVFSPVADNWWTQKYNVNRFPVADPHAGADVLMRENEALRLERDSLLAEGHRREQFLTTITSSIPYRVWLRSRMLLPRAVRRALGSPI